MSNETIRTLHTKKLGKVSDKWDSYLDYYDEALVSIRDQDVSILEVGVQNGGSLETWSTYFKNGKSFIGCDIDPNCAHLKYEDSRINIVIGDVNSQDAYNKITSIESSFDLVIDDGSHQSIDIINAFINYFGLVKPGGRYIIEDSHCLYMSSFGGGILNEYSAQYFFKKLTDIVSYQWWKSDSSIDVYLQTFFTKQAIPTFIADGWIDSIEFRNSIITIRKSKQSGHDKLGERVISGTDSLVQNWGGNNPI
jgi:hypothetical protein